MNNTFVEQDKCLDATQEVSLATAIVSLLLILSEIAPYVKPKHCCNGVIQTLVCIARGQKCCQNNVIEQQEKSRH